MRRIGTLARGFLMGAVGIAASAAFGQGDAKPEQRDLYRPAFHFTPQKNWMNDPNGLVYFDGEYHLFYQYNPEGISWGHMSWGHAVSRDLVHWDHLPVAIPEKDGVMVFSGSAVVDEKNTSGLGKDGAPPMVAIFTGHREKDGRQFQCIASSVDKGRTWTRYEGNPVIDIGSNNFRDPKVSWNAREGCWVMVVALSEERKVRFYRSSNLKEWTQTGEFGGRGSVNGVWECPDLFALKDATGGEKWVLIVNVGWGGPQGGNGCQYFVGSFDGKTFTADEPREGAAPLWLDQGRDFYAAVTWNGVPKARGESEARRLLMGWMVNGEYAGSTPTWPWRSAMTIPRELTLAESGGLPRVASVPVRELGAALTGTVAASDLSIGAANALAKDKALHGGHFDMSVNFRPGSATRFGLKARVGAGEETLVGYDVAKGEMFVDRRRSGESGFHPAFAGVHATKLDLKDGQVKLRVIVDSCSVEVFGNGGAAALTDLIYPKATSDGVEFWEEGGSARIETLEWSKIGGS